HQSIVQSFQQLETTQNEVKKANTELKHQNSELMTVNESQQAQITSLTKQNQALLERTKPILTTQNELERLNNKQSKQIASLTEQNQQLLDLLKQHEERMLGLVDDAN
ncbi:hypothetical protein DPE72_24320, partial [Salmonella enterica subsp. enterica]|nr:hypothetical protein [Salmonella enterica subsp. enterica serovar Agona]